jgi:FtsP/CotA-like multicopper oxidase with cupredoxin domain
MYRERSQEQNQNNEEEGLMQKRYYDKISLGKRFATMFSIALLTIVWPLSGHAAPPTTPTSAQAALPTVPAFTGDGYQADYDVLDPVAIPKFVQPLVIPPVMPKSKDNKADYNISMRQFKQQILPGGIWNTVNGRRDKYPATTVWSYGKSEDPYNLNYTAPMPMRDPRATSFNYPALTVEATQNKLTRVRWKNELFDPASRKFLKHLLPVDRTLHWANPEQLLCRDGSFSTDCMPAPSNGLILQQAYDGPVPIVTHVHGAHVNPESDGYPEAWWLPDARNIPSGYAKKGGLYDQFDRTNTTPGSALYGYYNTQRASTLWYHDHGLGITRVNVYAGPAGFWLIRGQGGSEPDLLSGVLPGPAPALGEDPNFDPYVRSKIREVPIVIQDRTFNPDGQLFFPNNRAYFEALNKKKTTPPTLNVSFNPEPPVGGGVSDVAPIWNPEFFGNTMVVNGTTWPVYHVAPARYRLRLLNGCNARTLILKMISDDSLVKLQTNFDTHTEPLSGDHIVTELEPRAFHFYQIGSDGGLLPGAAVPLDQLLMMPAERSDIIVDFTGQGSKVFYMINEGPDEPFGGGEPVTDFHPSNPYTTGMIMKFVVDSAADQNPTSTPTDLHFADIPRLVPSNTRRVSLNEMESESVFIVVDSEGNYVLDSSGNVSECHPTNFIPAVATDLCVPFGPTEAKVGTVTNDPNGSGGFVGIPLMWADMTGVSKMVKVFTKSNGDPVMAPVTEMPKLNDTEEWEIWNFTMDAHPIHLHLVDFQVVGREDLTTDAAVTSFKLAGNRSGPEIWETGWKDTVVAYPGQVTRIQAKFNIPGLYVWHCHIIDHEDNEMMRPYAVLPDLNKDGCVDRRDLAILASDIARRGRAYDLNGDGEENAKDLLRLTMFYTNRLGAPCR